MFFAVVFQPFARAGDRSGTLQLGDALVTIDYPASLDTQERALTQQWLQSAVVALTTVYGQLPRQHFKITLDHRPEAPEPVPWGHIERGSPTSVYLVINPSLGEQALLSDWTIFHELSHLLIPYRGFGDLWFSEGLATYYQNIIQARSGLMDETQMWQRLVVGLERGAQQTDWDHLTLEEVSGRMRETRQFMRIHWSGVLYWLNIDVHLRRHGKGSLDTALHRLKTCCEHRSMSAQAIAARLDQLTHSDIFVRLFQTYRDSSRLPRFNELLVQLGVMDQPGKTLVAFDEDAPLAGVRRGLLSTEPTEQGTFPVP